MRHLIAAGIALVVAMALPAFAQQAEQPKAVEENAEPPAAAQTFRVTFEARMTETGAPIPAGVEWRIFGTQTGEDGKLPLLAEAKGGVRSFDMSGGEYFVHAAFGYAGAVRRIVISEPRKREVFTLNAGAMQLGAVTVGEVRIPTSYLRFDIYSREADDRGERQLIARNIRPGEVVPFHAGTYHVVSQYGNLNAEIRADLRVEPGKITQASLLHRAARMSFRLVQSAGGDAIADTAWSLITESGDLITESSSAFPTFVLTEGSYTAIAKNRDKVYQRDFNVISGVDQDIEVLIQ
jgi:hypothetical protein